MTETKYSRGPKTRHIPMDRVVKQYAISEHELTTISVCNAQVSIWSSVMSACLALIAACIWDIVTTEDVNKSAATVFIVFVGIFASISAGLAVYHYFAKKREIKAIKDEAIHPEG